MPARLSNRTISAIMDLRAKGWHVKTIARHLKIHNDTARRYCKIADKIISLEPGKVKEGMAELERLKPKSIAQHNRNQKVRAALDSVKVVGNIINLFRRVKDGK